MFINLNSRHFRHKWVCHQFRNGLYGNNRMPEISVNHTDLGTAILRCPFPEIRDIIWIWVQPFFIVNMHKSGIIIWVWEQQFFIVNMQKYVINIWVWEQLFLIFYMQKSLSRSFPNSWLITGFVTRLTRWVLLVEQ
jgi:hypothetical protein